MVTAVLPSVEFDLERILDRLCVNLQLNETQVNKAQQNYESVTTWLADENSIVFPYFPLLYPQGSLLLDTTVRPIYQIEFDLDVVCVLSMGRPCTPEEVYKLIWDRMHEHKFYRDIMERKDRCVRLNYAKDSQFHLDIVPAVIDMTKGGTHILIADMDGRWMVWKTSNPKGFLRWFVSRKVVFEKKFARALIEPLQRPLSVEMKAVLTKCVQLIKRWRDVKWKDDQPLATPSIILTYLAAACYEGEATLIEAMTTILVGMEDFVRSGEREIVNPANRAHPAEVISEKWLNRPACYDAFAAAIPALREEWESLVYHKRGTKLYESLNELFGDQATRAIKDASESITEARTNGDLYAAKERARLLISAPAAALSAAGPDPKKRRQMYCIWLTYPETSTRSNTDQSRSHLEGASDGSASGFGRVDHVRKQGNGEATTSRGSHGAVTGRGCQSDGTIVGRTRARVARAPDFRSSQLCRRGTRGA